MKSGWQAAEALLDHVFPAVIRTRLVSELLVSATLPSAPRDNSVDSAIAQSFDATTIVFADLAGFTAWAGYAAVRFGGFVLC